MACLAGAAGATAQAPLSVAPLLLPTPWDGAVSHTSPLPDYPRPQLERNRWQSLNGQWGYETCATPGLPAPKGGCPAPFSGDVPQTALVPFPISSALSGIGRYDTQGWYRRTFTVPAAWHGRHVMVNFGAVSWATTVYVNRKLVVTHRGDYDAFSADITTALHAGNNQIVVGFRDPMGLEGEPDGKQALGFPPKGITHTPANGIWQTVWIEPVARRHLAALELTPDLAHRRLLINATVAGGGGGLTLNARALAGSKTAAVASGPADRTLAVPLGKGEHLWWPWQPYLYGLRVTLTSQTTTDDAASSYFGMRSVSLGRVDGATRILINNRFVFQSGALDQGYWPNGIYTPSSDAALRFDVSTAKSLGYNMLREHQKVEPDRWYLWADKLGLLVWQDMPDVAVSLTHPLTRSQRAEFRRELEAIVRQLRSHPSIVTWIPFNEGWGQFDLPGVTADIRRLDRNALVDSQSGSANCCDAQETTASDTRDTHLYTGPYTAPPDRRASVVGEYGGVLPVPPVAHRWPYTLYSVGSTVLAWPESYITGVLRRQYSMLEQEMRYAGLSASVYTEYDSPEEELGIVTYDRRAYTIAPAFLSSLNQPLIAASLRLGGPLKKVTHPTLPTGTSGYWRLSSARGGQIPDASGFGQSLALAPGARFTTGPNHRGALVLPGLGPVALSASPVLTTQASYTVSAWLRSDRVGQSGSAISQPGPVGSSFSLGAQTDRGRQGQSRSGQAATGIAPAQTRTWWTFVGAQGATCPILKCGSRANLHYDDGRDGVRTGRWHHVVGVVDRDTQTISIYVDGEPQDVEHLGASPVSSGPLALGGGTAVYTPGADAFAGAIAALRVYNRALTPAAVWQLYQASLPAEP